MSKKSEKEGASKESRGMYGFDPSGLERAAEAAKILDQSTNAKQAFELALKEEEAKILNEKRIILEQDILRTKVEQDEKRKTLKLDMDIQKDKARYEDYLAKQRIEYRLQREKEANDKVLQSQEESVKRQEAQRKATLEYEHQLKLQQEKEKLEKKFQIKAATERKNFDLTEKKIRIKAAERRETSKNIAEISLNMIGQGMKKFINDKTMMVRVLFGLTTAYVVGFACKSGIKLLCKYLSMRLMTPKLVRETSRVPLNRFYMIPAKWFMKMIIPFQKKDLMEGIILKPSLENQLRVISHAVINRKKHFAPFRNLLFYGPPGTGKTLFAKQLAYRSGLDYAIMTGADVAPLGPLAVNELHKIFDWAETSTKGLLLFIDEADSFVRRRSGDELISENLRNAINAFLYRTGIQSTKCMVVLATNAPQLLDEALQDRMDEMVDFEKPSQTERGGIILFYLQRYFMPKRASFEYVKAFTKHPLMIIYGKKRINISLLDVKYIEDIARRTEGFSGRELTKLVVSWHDAAFAKDSPVLDKETIEVVLERHIKQKQIKGNWNEYQKEYFKLMHPH